MKKIDLILLYFVTFLMDNQLLPLAIFTAFYLIFVGIDTFLGRRVARVKAIKNGDNPREVIKSRITRIGFSTKMMVFFILGLFTFCIDYFIFDNLIFKWKEMPIHFIATNGFILIFTAMELDSIDESYYFLKGKTIKGAIKTQLLNVKRMIMSIINFKRDIE